MIKEDLEVAIEEFGIIVVLEFIQEILLERALDVEEKHGFYPAKPWRKAAQIVKQAYDKIEREAGE